MLITWDMRQFRNGVVHGGDSIATRALHVQLNRVIEEAFLDDTDNLRESDHYILRRTTPLTVQRYDLVSKQNRVASFLAARRAFHVENQQRSNSILRYVSPLP